jgi:6-phosphogluconolactonase
MKFRKFGRPMMTAAFTLGAAAIFNGCGATGTHNTVDYVYVTNTKNNPGQINVYYADSQSGGLHQIPDSPYPSGGRNPVALVRSPDFKSLYVVNHDDNTIVEFGIGSDAKLYPQHTYETQGNYPNAIAIDSTGSFLIVTCTYQPQYTANPPDPGPGDVEVYPINADGSLGSAVANGNLPYFPLSVGQTNVLNPNALNIVNLSGGAAFVYVASQNTSSTLGSISAYSLGSGGVLTAIPCTAPSVCDASGNGTFRAGIMPSAITSTPLGLYLYATDSTSNQLLSYAIQSTGQILPLGSVSTDEAPDSVIVDPAGDYVYVANYTGNNVTSYSINSSTSSSPGSLVPVSTYGTGAGPTCVFIEPALGSYLYTTNFLDNTITGYNKSSTTGSLTAIQNTGFGAAGQPTCITATPHGTHPAITSAN